MAQYQSIKEKITKRNRKVWIFWAENLSKKYDHGNMYDIKNVMS